MKKDKKLAKKIKDTKQEVAECHTSDNEGNDFVFHFCNPTIDELSTLRGVFWQTMDENSENLPNISLGWRQERMSLLLLFIFAQIFLLMGCLMMTLLIVALWGS